MLLLYVDDTLVDCSNMDKIKSLKGQFSREFETKDTSLTKKILGMQITRDKERGILQLSKIEYNNHILQRFNMGDAKPICTPLASHFCLSKDQPPQTDEGTEFMASVLYKAKSSC